MGQLLVLKNFRLVDEFTDTFGSIVIEGGIIREIIPQGVPEPGLVEKAALVIDGLSMTGPAQGNFSSNDPAQYRQAILMPAFVDLHTHFRDPGFSKKTTGQLKETWFLKETLESGSLAAAAGGFGTVFCMANTNPVLDSLEKITALKQRSDSLALIDLYPLMSLTKAMEGKELSGIASLTERTESSYFLPLMLSEDGKDIADEELFLKAMAEARRLDIPVSCHCDFGGEEAQAAKNAGKPRSVWSRLEENNAAARVIELGKRALCRIHIAHVSTREAIETIRRAKKDLAVGGNHLSKNGTPGFTLSCEAAPHHFCLTEEDAQKMGAESHGRVNPPLRSRADMEALKEAIQDGTIDAIATDHAPHSLADKDEGAPGFSGLETAFAASFSELVLGRRAEPQGPCISLMHLSALMSANPCRVVGLEDRGLLKAGLRGDLVILRGGTCRQVEPGRQKTRGGNSAFRGKSLYGEIIMTIHGGRIVYEG